MAALVMTSGIARAEEPAPPAAEAAPDVQIRSGGMLYGPDGNRLGAIYRVTVGGDAQLIINGKLVTVPASTLSNASGKIATTLTKSDLTRAR